MSVMLVVTLRVQLNIVGGYLFKDANAVSTHVQETYLSLCNNLLDSGLQTIADLVEGQVIIAYFTHYQCNKWFCITV